MFGCCKFLGVRILCSCICPLSSGHDVPANFQQVKCYSILQFFVSIWMEECYTYTGQSLQNGLPCVFQAIEAFFYRRWRGSIAKHWQQKSTRVKVKELDLPRNRVCSIILHIQVFRPPSFCLKFHYFWYRYTFRFNKLLHCNILKIILHVEYMNMT